MARRWRSEAGQTAAEYLGVLVVVAAMVAGVAASGIAPRIAGAVERAVCTIAGSCAAATAAPAPAADPAAVEDAARDLAALAAAGRGPEAVAERFRALDPAVARAVAHRYPALVGNLDGAPFALRYEANDLALGAEIARLEALGDDADGDRLDKLRELRDDDARLLLFDPAGDGRIARVYGDLSTSRHVAVVVPGMNNELNNFSGANAERLQRQAEDFAPGEVAAIQWLGYDTPEGATALGGGAAEPGARALPGFTEGITAARGERVHLTIVAHSYGSLVTGKALEHEGLGVDDVAFVGSPGVGASSVDELGAGSTRVFAGVARNDVVGGSGWHGPPPTNPNFGSTEFHTGDISGHSSYFNEGSESLRNLGLIVAGRPEEVSRTR